MELTGRIRRAAFGLTWRDAAANFTPILAYGAAGMGGLQLAFFHPQATTIWPPSGIALAALLLSGARVRNALPPAGAPQRCQLASEALTAEDAGDAG